MKKKIDKNTKLFFVVCALLVFYITLRITQDAQFIDDYLNKQVCQRFESYGLTCEFENSFFSFARSSIVFSKLKIAELNPGDFGFAPITFDKVRVQVSIVSLLLKKLQIQKVVVYQPVIDVKNYDLLKNKINQIISEESPREGKQTYVSPNLEVRVVDGFVRVKKEYAGIESFEIHNWHFKSSLYLGYFNNVVSSLDRVVFNTKDDAKKIVVNSINGSCALERGVYSVLIEMYEKPQRVIIKSRLSSLSQFKFNYEIKSPLDQITLILKTGKIEGVFQSQGFGEYKDGIVTLEGKLKTRDVVSKFLNAKTVFADYKVRLEKGLLKFELNEARVEAEKNSYIEGDLTYHSHQDRLEYEFSAKNYDFSKSLNYVIGKDIFREFVFTGESSTDSSTDIIDVNGQLKVLDLGRERSELKLDHADLKLQLFQNNLLSAQLNSDIGSVVVRSPSEEMYHVHVQNLNLGELRLKFLDVKGNVDVDLEYSSLSNEAEGVLKIKNFYLENVKLHQVTTPIYYANNTLNFAQIKSQSSLGVTSSVGKVDLKNNHLNYYFEISQENQPLYYLSDIIQYYTRDFEMPLNGRLTTSLVIQNSPINQKFELLGTGHTQNLVWYGESFKKSQVKMKYQYGHLNIENILLEKETGSLNVSVNRKNKDIVLRVDSDSGIQINEIDCMKKSGLKGAISGSLEFTPPFDITNSSGKVFLSDLVLNSGHKSHSSVAFFNGSRKGFVFEEKKTKSFLSYLSDEKSSVFKLDVKKFDFLPYLVLSFPELKKIFQNIKATIQGEIFSDGSHVLLGSGQMNVSQFEAVTYNDDSFRLKNESHLIIDKTKIIPQDEFVLLRKNGAQNIWLNPSLNKNQLVSVIANIGSELIAPFIPFVTTAKGRVSCLLDVYYNKNRSFSWLSRFVSKNTTFKLNKLMTPVNKANFNIVMNDKILSFQDFYGHLGGGVVSLKGDVKHSNFFETVDLNLSLIGKKANFQMSPRMKFIGNSDLKVTGQKKPYLIQGRAYLKELLITDMTEDVYSDDDELFRYDISMKSTDGIKIKTDDLSIRYSADLKLVGLGLNKIGLLGKMNLVEGTVSFYNKEFDILSSEIFFDKVNQVKPNVKLRAKTSVLDVESSHNHTYDVFLEMVGDSEKQNVKLVSIPDLSEKEILSLLIFGTTSKNNDPSFVEVSTMLLEGLPFYKKLNSNLGIDIKVKERKDSAGFNAVQNDLQNAENVPVFEVKKKITDKTAVKFSNTLGAEIPTSEVEVQHQLNKTLSVSGTVSDKLRGSSNTQKIQSFGVDLKYNFMFD